MNLVALILTYLSLSMLCLVYKPHKLSILQIVFDVLNIVMDISHEPPKPLGFFADLVDHSWYSTAIVGCIEGRWSCSSISPKDIC